VLSSGTHRHHPALAALRDQRSDVIFPERHRVADLDGKKLAAFSALGGGFLQFAIGDRR